MSQTGEELAKPTSSYPAAPLQVGAAAPVPRASAAKLRPPRRPGVARRPLAPWQTGRGPETLAVDPRTGRLLWPDIARAICIIGVVYLHVTMNVYGADRTFLWTISQFLSAFEMPLFFLVSGYFATRVRSWSFKTLCARRLWVFGVIYLAWMPAEHLLMRSWRSQLGLNPPPSLQSLWHSVAFGSGIYWFFHALIVFNLYLWLTRKLPRGACLTLAFLPLALLVLDFDLPLSYLPYLPFFLVGALWRADVSNLAARATEVPVAATVIGLALCGYALLWDLVPQSLRPLTPEELLPAGTDPRHLAFFLTRMLCVPFGLALAVWLSHLPRLGGALRRLGRHTTEIYLGHHLGYTLLFCVPVLGFGLVKSAPWLTLREVTGPLPWYLDLADPRGMLLWFCYAAVAAVCASYVVYRAGRDTRLRAIIRPRPLAS